jgi:hypothetical protein
MAWNHADAQALANLCNVMMDIYRVPAPPDNVPAGAEGLIERARRMASELESLADMAEEKLRRLRA